MAEVAAPPVEEEGDRDDAGEAEEDTPPWELPAEEGAEEAADEGGSVEPVVPHAQHSAAAKAPRRGVEERLNMGAP